MNNIEVVGLGALNIDHIYQVELILDDGETVVKESILSPAAQPPIPSMAWPGLG